MARISDLKTQVKRTERISVYIDGAYALSLSRDQVAGAGLKIGQEITESELRALNNDSVFGKLRDNTFKWLSIRLRSEHEIDQYLKRKTDDADLVERVKEHLRELGYIDDRKFASMWVRNRTLLKPMSTYRIKQELIQKRVPKTIIDETLIAEAPNDDLTAAKALLAKRLRRGETNQQKLLAYLSRQGFSYDIARQALESSEQSE